jgi:flagellar biosynthesis/type III secretory pathway protein FliH
MAEFHLQITPDLSSVTVPGAVVTIQQASTAASPTKSHDAEAVDTLRAIETRLSALEAELHNRMDQVGQRIISLAIEITGSILNEDDSLIEKRVRHYLELALDQSDIVGHRTVYVHPTCVPPIKRWIEETGVDSITVKEDVSVIPGDCRLESGNNGVSLALDAYLDAMSSHLNSKRTMR